MDKNEIKAKNQSFDRLIKLLLSQMYFNKGFLNIAI